MKRKRKTMWGGSFVLIPVEVYESESLSAIQKLLLAEIYCLDRKSLPKGPLKNGSYSLKKEFEKPSAGGCKENDKYFAKFLGFKKVSIKDLLSKLKKSGWIKILYNEKKERVIRYCRRVGRDIQMPSEIYFYKNLNPEDKFLLTEICYLPYNSKLGDYVSYEHKIEEFAKFLKVTKKTVQKHLKQMEKRGFIKIRTYKKIEIS